MPLGIVPSNGQWETKWFETASAATFPKGALVTFNPGYQVREYASTDSAIVGVALSYSTASTSIRGLNMVEVAVPLPGAKAYADITTGIAQSALSIGKKVCAEKRGNYMSFASTVIGEASRFSAIFQVAGPIDATRSRVEVAINAETAAFYSTSSTTFAS